MHCFCFCARLPVLPDGLNLCGVYSASVFSPGCCGVNWGLRCLHTWIDWRRWSKIRGHFPFFVSTYVDRTLMRNRTTKLSSPRRAGLDSIYLDYYPIHFVIFLFVLLIMLLTIAHVPWIAPRGQIKFFGFELNWALQWFICQKTTTDPEPRTNSLYVLPANRLQNFTCQYGQYGPLRGRDAVFTASLRHSFTRDFINWIVVVVWCPASGKWLHLPKCWWVISPPCCTKLLTHLHVVVVINVTPSHNANLEWREESPDR